jgi:hypothetical protein
MGYAAPGHCGCDTGRPKRKKLRKLADIEGYESVMALIEANCIDSVVPAICMNAGCDYTDYLEPDQKRGWCDVTSMMRLGAIPNGSAALCSPLGCCVEPTRLKAVGPFVG